MKLLAKRYKVEMIESKSLEIMFSTFIQDTNFLSIHDEDTKLILRVKLENYYYITGRGG